MSKYFNFSLKNWILIIIISIYVLSLSTIGGNSCISGFPINFWQVCIDSESVSIIDFIVGLFVDLVFWFTIVYISFCFFKWTSKKTFLKYFINPIFLTVLGFSVYSSCGGFICFFKGHGFPISYFDDGEFYIWVFLIDLLFLALVNFVILKIWGFINRKFDLISLNIKKRFELNINTKKTKLFIFSYLIFWLFFYGIYFLYYINTHMYDDFVYFFQDFILFIVIPYLSFIVPNFIKKVLNDIDNKELYLIHFLVLIIIVLISILIFKI